MNTLKKSQKNWFLNEITVQVKSPIQIDFLIKIGSLMKSQHEKLVVVAVVVVVVPVVVVVVAVVLAVVVVVVVIVVVVVVPAINNILTMHD